MVLVGQKLKQNGRRQNVSTCLKLAGNGTSQNQLKVAETCLKLDETSKTINNFNIKNILQDNQKPVCLTKTFS